ncbi:MAG: hypothetical protein IIC51_04105 [Planctomycetes bacterium]|nr:hypothetical protein [Planctomycetota bacterium]
MIAPAPTKINGKDARVALSRFAEDGRTEEEGGAPGAGPPDAGPCFVLHTLLADVARHEELDLDTLTYHVRQSDATAADGYWHASINEARSFLEALLVGILYSVCAEEADKQKGMSRNSTPFRCYRRRLLEAGFLDADENDLLQYVYSIASAKGSHHGATDEAWTRLARRMVWTAGEHLLTRFEAWKSGGMKPRIGTLDRASWWSLASLRACLRRVFS